MESKNFSAFISIFLLIGFGLFYIYISLISRNSSFNWNFYILLLFGFISFLIGILILFNYKKEDKIEVIKNNIKEK